jgi:NAD(P)H dehydrogenase (quinone)
MRHLIIYAHPNDNSLNGHFKKTVIQTLLKNGHEIILRDLNQAAFSPVLTLEDMQGQRSGTVSADVQAEQEYISWAECITFIYPIWWTGMPAIMKGYIDRVFSYGFAYRYDQGVQQGLLKDKQAIIINTHGKSHSEYEAIGMDKALALTSDKGIFQYSGLEVSKHFYFDGADRATAAHAARWITEITILYNH